MAEALIQVAHVVKGDVLATPDVEHTLSDGTVFVTPKLELGDLVWPRAEPGPAFDVPVSEIIDVLVGLGERLRDHPDYLQQSVDQMVQTNPLGRAVLERSYSSLWRSFEGDALRAMLEAELGGPDVIDHWRPAPMTHGRTGRVRAFPPRLVHVLAGNAPGVAAVTLARAAMTKGVHLLKLPSNDLFTAPGLLRAMADVAPGHPLLRSFSAVYWRGGDEMVESVLFRAQFFDKLVAWGGDAAIRGALRYVAPGFELVSFDPKNSVSFIGREAFASEASLQEAADLAATDATAFNQEACLSSRFQYVEGTVEDVDRFCAVLVGRLGVERATASAVGAPVPPDVREEIEALALMDDLYQVWGEYDGSGLVIRSEDPVEFYPSGKVVNVVPVPHLGDAVRFANVSTQTVGVYPPSRKAELRDALASAGVQRIIPLGMAAGGEGGSAGLPHDGFYPMHRFVRWVAETD